MPAGSLARSGITHAGMGEVQQLRDNYFHLSWEQLLELLHTSRDTGLATDETTRRLETYGENRVQGKSGVSGWRILARHTFNFFQGVLFVALIVSLAIKEWIDAGVVLILIVVNILLGFVQEYRAEQTLQKLRQLSAPSASVLRAGRVQEVPTETIVPGDVLLLVAGDRVPADVRLYDVAELETDEALLTGESQPVEKANAMPARGTDTVLAERTNCAFMGTACVRGTARGVVVSTGQNTELGRIAESLRKSKKEVTLLQKRLNRLGQIVVLAALICCGIVLLAGHLWGTFKKLLKDGLQTAVSTAVAIIPESLLPVLTLSLTLGVRRLAKHNAIIRRLGAIEALGNITHICADKTGTLTLGHMTAAQLRVHGEQVLLFRGVQGEKSSGIDPRGALVDSEGNAIANDRRPPTLSRALQVLSLCTVATLEQSNEADGVETWHGNGSPTEVALLVAAYRANAPPSSYRTRVMRSLPFDSTVKRMSVLLQIEGEAMPVLLVKGAPEQLLRVCTRMSDGSEMNDEAKAVIHADNESVAAEGMRVLALAWRAGTEADANTTRENLERGLTWLGFVALADPPRSSVRAAIEACHNAGIQVHMATGDQAATARSIGKAVAILPDEPAPGMVLTAADFDGRAEDDTSELPLVIARCTPQSKVRLINELHKRNGYVAMTGDGVNDAPALAGADVGVAMSNASDVAKEAADMVLTADDFGVIVRAIEEGRRIFANIRKFVILYLTSNVAEVVVLVIGICSSLPPPLLPIQILWVNLITGTPPAMALAAQPFHPELMDKRVRPPGEGLFTPETVVDIIVYGLILGGADLSIFVLLRYVFEESLPQCQAATFAGLTWLLALHAYNALHQRKSFLTRKLFTVKECWVLHGTVWLSICSLFLTFYVGWIRKHIFHQSKPTGPGWGLVVAAAFVFLFLSECYKFCKRIWFGRRDRTPVEREMNAIAPV